MSRIQIVTSRGTEQAGKQLADAIQDRLGASVAVSPVTAAPGSGAQLGRILDTLAVLRETEATLRREALRVMAANPALIRGTRDLTLDDRIANTVHNRAEIRAVLKDSRPVHPPEQMILAGAAATLGGEAQHLGSLVSLSAQHATVAESTFRAGLNHPAQSAKALDRQIQARIDRAAEVEPAGEDEYEPGDD